MSNIDYKKACRICLVNGATIPIFETVKKKYSDLKHKLFLCFGVKIVDFQGYPRNICESCYIKVCSVITFRDKYEESCKILERKFQQIIKQEPDVDNYHFDDFETIDVGPHQVKIEENKTKPKIVFSNANQLVELIKPLVNNVGQLPPNVKLELPTAGTEITEHKPVKKNKENKKAQVKRTINKNKENSKTHVKKTIKKSKDSKKQLKKREYRGVPKNATIAASILEGDFVFTGEQWEIKPKKAESTKTKHKEVETPQVEVKDENNTDKQNLRLCELCGATFTVQEHYRRHMQLHKTKDTTKYQCSFCGKVLNSNSILRRHIKAKHMEKQNVCTQCGKAYSFTNELQRHIQYFHLKMPRTPRVKKCCHICGKLYATAKAVLMHVRSVHTGERPAVCSVCDAKFIHDDYLKEHMRLHTGETPFKCPVCNRGYAQAGNMKSHISHNHRLADLSETQRKAIHPRYLRFMKP